jgi:hypothetical protein
MSDSDQHQRNGDSVAVWLLRLLNVAAFFSAVVFGGVVGAMRLAYLLSSLGVKPNVGVFLAGYGLGGLAGFFAWAGPQIMYLTNSAAIENPAQTSPPAQKPTQ